MQWPDLLLDLMGGITGTAAFLQALGGVPIKEPLVDNTPLGDYWCRANVFISAGPFISAGVQLGFPLAIKLPRQPSFFFYTTSNGCVCYQTPLDVASSTPSTFYVTVRQGTNVYVSTSGSFLIG